MDNYDNTNSGALFKNDKEGNEKRPDYKGSLNVDGKELWISAWLKTSAKGTKYMSLSVQPKEEKVAQKPAEAVSEDFDDDVPF